MKSYSNSLDLVSPTSSVKELMSLQMSVTLASCFRKESYGTENADGGDPLDCHFKEYEVS